MYRFLHKPQYLRHLFIAALALLPLAVMNDARACAACGDTLSRDWGAQGGSAEPGYTADLSYSYINQNQQRYDSSTASPGLISSLQAAGQEIEDYTVTRTTTAALNYSSDTWGITAQIPYLQRAHGTFGTASDGSTYSSSYASGIGDIRIIGRYNGFLTDRTTGIIAGIKLPTGSTNTNFNSGDAANTPVDRSLQLGTGSTDLILGGIFTGTAGKFGWFAQGTMQYAVTTKTIDGLDYRPGNAYALNAGLRYAKFGARFTPLLQINYIHRQPDTGAGATPNDALTGGPATGGTLVYLAPGVSARIGGGTSVYGFVQLPLYQHVNSLQLSPRYTLTLGIRHAF
ncbi:MAG: hypothetical protein V4443_00565 [Pseudomonadota bacterium]